MRTFILVMCILVFGYAFKADDLTQNADRYGSLAGRIIVLPLREPAIAAISIYRIEQKPGSSEIRIAFEKSIRTDSDGNYRTDLRAGDYMVSAEMTGFYASKAWNVHINPAAKRIVDMGIQVWGGDNIDSMGPSFDIKGTITSESGLPISDATITLFNVDNNEKIFQERSDLNGQYLFTPFRSGRYIVYAAKGKSASSPVSIQIPAKERCDIVIVPH